MTLESYDNVLAAICIWREARGASLQAQLGVFWTIWNRAMDQAGRWPKSLAGVATQPLQFSSFNKDDPNAVKWPGPGDSQFAAICAMVDSPGADPTGGANHYHSFSREEKFPAWASVVKLTCQIGPFRFYKL